MGPFAPVASSRSLVTCAAFLIWLAPTAVWPDDPPASPPPASISYQRQVLPIFQAHCQGCHQPAKRSGDYVMTAFTSLRAGGESGQAAIVPYHPAESYLLELITPTDGQAEMPAGRPPLSEPHIALIRQWIAEGAQDDSRSDAPVIDDAHPPVYTTPPVVSAVASSPDGRLIAVAGYHEVLVHRADGSGLAARLIGISERIQSLEFSPDGKRLAVAGGLPARSGELQVWNMDYPFTSESADVDRPALLQSISVAADTLYGCRWSSDGRLISVGCPDNTVRAFEAETGKQVLFQGAHSDWVLDTVFSVDNSHLISVGRDMAAKLTEVATERFVDNITSITPGALKGGILSVARHPSRDEIVIGGADGVPKVYRVFRQTERRIGDDANLLRQLPPLSGRVFSVAISSDGSRIASGSSLDGRGQVAIDTYEFDTALPEDIQQINAKVVTDRTPDEHRRLAEYHQSGLRRLALVELPAAVYAVDFLGDTKSVVAAGSDGIMRILDSEQGSIVREFAAAPLATAHSTEAVAASAPVIPFGDTEPTEDWPTELVITGLSTSPAQIELTSPIDYVQLVVTATLADGRTVDVTRAVQMVVQGDNVRVSHTGTVQPQANGATEITFELGGQTSVVPCTVHGLDHPFQPNYLRDVAPIMTKLGCNQGTCHGAAQGKNGFKLSLRGYDAIFDLRALTDDHASRRTNTTSPENSLILLKGTASVPHVGGQLTKQGEAYYQVLRDWLANGARYQADTPRVTAIDIFPHNPVIETLGARQQIRVVATYADGQTRDVTRESFVTSGNTEVATAGTGGLMTAVRRGEAPILARYQGSYAATTLTAMGDRSGFVWEEPEAYNRIDELVAAKWKRLKLQPSPLCSDAEYLRRVTLDLTGLPPSAETTRLFLADQRDSRSKREAVVDQLIGSPEFVDYWTNKWADLLDVNRKFLGPEGAAEYRTWVRDQIAQNRPYDQFVRDIVTATGSNRVTPAASYYKILRTPTAAMEATTQLFLAIRFNCNKCHDHPFERWTQDQYYETSAYFAQFSLQPDPESKDRTIGGSAVEGAQPYYEIVSDAPAGEVKHDRTGQITSPQFPYVCQHVTAAGEPRRQQFAAWLTSADNPYFARSYVNRLWGYLTGVGIIEPLDDIRAGNPPSNPELLDYLTKQFMDSGFNVRQVMRLICTSRTYQLSVATNPWNSDDQRNYAHATARRLPAEVLFDAVHEVTGTTPTIPGVPAGTRAVQLPDTGVTLPSGFLETLGRPVRESVCECERSNDIQLGPIMAMLSGPVVAEAIAHAQNAITRLTQEQADDSQLVDELFLRILNRHATNEELSLLHGLINQIDLDHQQLMSRLDAAEAEWIARRQQLEQERTTAMGNAQNDLTAYEQRIAPQQAEMEQQRVARSQAADAAVTEFETQVDQHFDTWAAGLAGESHWYPLAPRQLESSNGAVLEPLEDRSVRASGDGEKGVYTVTYATRLRDISGLRLEALPVSGIPGGGPGLPENGNFVVTEFEVFTAAPSSPTEWTPIPFERATADFTQQGFEIAQAIDGVAKDQRGWAVHPAGGTVHWATFQTRQPIGDGQGILLQVRIHQYHDAQLHRLARFRVSVTTDANPIGLGLPESLASIRVTPPAQRSTDSRKFVLDYFRRSYPPYQQLLAAAEAARQPLPTDPGVIERRALIEALSAPVRDDPALVQLREDARQSAEQLKNKRLTAAQDLAWALINSPAFLFNY